MIKNHDPNHVIIVLILILFKVIYLKINIIENFMNTKYNVKLYSSHK